MSFKPKKIWTIAWKDFRTYFTSPIAYIIIAGFLIIMGWMFFFNLSHFNMQALQYKQMGMGKSMSITEGIIRPLYGNMNVIFLFLVPFITMRLFAEERKQQTIQLLMTSPISIAEMVVGKFFSAFFLVFTMLMLTVVYPIILWIFGNPDYGPILTSYMGTLMLSSCYVAAGVFFSSMTENQIVAGALTFAAGLFFWLINWASQSAGPVFSDILDYMSLIQHYNNFSQGIIDTTDIVFYLSFVFVSLFLSHRVLDSYRWR
ncbi:MAG: ABC transporter permease subunit [Bdellovibrionales bacterium]|nr:ABC transporter permease subunit [Bdellovibrionales bacterium]